MNRKIDKKTKQVVISSGYHKLLRKYAANNSMTIKQATEGALADLLEVKSVI